MVEKMTLLPLDPGHDGASLYSISHFPMSMSHDEGKQSV